MLCSVGKDIKTDQLLAITALTGDGGFCINFTSTIRGANGESPGESVISPFSAKTLEQVRHHSRRLLSSFPKPGYFAVITGGSLCDCPFKGSETEG
jgi:hypothetical protein